MESPLVILPCAGFGRRVGSPPAKELLPLRNGQPLIDGPLLDAKHLHWDSVVVSRIEKRELNHYLATHFADTKLHLCQETEEWPQSVLESSKYWKTWNLLVLPDTAYSPEDIWLQMFRAIEAGTKLVVAEHPVSQAKLWGRVFIEGHQVLLAEKTDLQMLDSSMAWGLLLFHRSIGQALFDGFIESRKENTAIRLSQCQPDNVKFVGLQSFTDLTR